MIESFMVATVKPWLEHYNKQRYHFSIGFYETPVQIASKIHARFIASFGITVPMKKGQRSP